MTLVYRLHRVMVAAILIVCGGMFALADLPSAPPRGMVRVSSSARANEPYGKHWAVIVGIDYTDSLISADGRSVVPPLANAENDAQAVADLLIKHYGYDEDSLKLLKGSEATREKIQEALSGGFLGKESQVGENDSVLFFFAGHGYRFDKMEGTAELLPWDVKLERNTPIQATCIPLEDQVVKYLRSSPAKHKLVVLDCCYSGDIFTQSSQVHRRVSSTLQTDSGLLRTLAFQAIASCRREQQASDGKIGHSPFTSSLLSALKVIPRQQGTRDPIKASDLFTFMQDELRAAPALDQSAALGWLTSDQGEFHFLPNPKSDFTGYSSHTDDEILKAIAMAPGTYGAWWFDEMPWFMPSLRSRILANVERPRSTTADWVKKRQLEQSAREVLRAMEHEPGELANLRVRHLKLLLDPNTRHSPEKAYRQIANELREVAMEIGLEASDIHLLAAIEHRLGENARQVYDNAIAEYEAGLRAGRKHDDALRLLCLADLGQYEFQENNYEQAALMYQRALAQRVLCPVPFQIHVLSCEADAWQQLGRWGEADAKLEQALRLAIPLADENVESPLTAYAYTRRAWGYMEQWKFLEAAKAFGQADEHLPKEYDREAAIIRLHNRHGLAMARRFTGDPTGALADYRRISTDIREIFSKLRQDAGVEQNYGEIRERLTERLVNTLERQADCNLFRDHGDMKEASDDLRRAIRVTDYLVPARRDPVKAALLYKQALALGCHSPYQDVELATGFLREAEAMASQLSEEQQRRLKYYKKLATAIVQVATDVQAADNDTGSVTVRREKRIQAYSSLRTSVIELRPQLNQSIPRDHLEVLLFAAQYLVTEGLADVDRYHLLNDAETLLLLCRHAMRSEPLVTQRYLRHHFDSAIRAMIAAKPKHVQGITEAVCEARLGRHYNKPELPTPTLTIYQLDHRYHAFLDVPSGISKVYLFDEGITIESLREAETNRKLLPLPRQLAADLESLKLTQAHFPEVMTDTVNDTQESLSVRWHDACYQLGTNAPDPVIGSEYSAGTRVAKLPVSPIATFPFELPNISLPKMSVPPAKVTLSP